MAAAPAASVARRSSAVAPPTEDRTPARSRPAAFHDLRVAAIDRITDDSVAITFDVPPELAEDYAHRAGQHVSVMFTDAGSGPDQVRRSYSICTPAGSGLLRIGVKRLPDGVFSTYAMDQLRVGDRLAVLTPSGTFGPRPGEASPVREDGPERRNYGAVAAGSGITPVLSIVATILDTEPSSRVTLVCVNRTSADIMFLEELEDLKDRYTQRLQVLHVLGHESQDAELLSGRLDEQRLTGLLDTFGPAADQTRAWFLCGPIGLTDMVATTLAARGVHPTAIHRELFHADAVPVRRPVPAEGRGEAIDGCAVTVVLDGRSTRFTMRPDTEPILDAVQRVRSEVPFACTNGVCGTCRCRLTDGTVEMVQNFALEPDELDRGYVLACQSYPTSPTVVVDFDQ